VIVLADADLAAVADLLSANRASLLLALIGGRPLAAGELASRCDISPSLASTHLARLLQAGLVTVEQHGRQRHYSLASPHVAEVLEAMLTIAPATPASSLGGSARGTAMSHARTCYDHLAGAVGVALTESMVRRRLIDATDAGFELTSAGHERLAGLGLDIAAMRRSRRTFARPCLDWTERRPHLAGSVAAGLCRRLSELHWIEPLPNSRAVRVTEAGRRGLLAEFGLNLAAMERV
jgi:DNA-binding transcriptional ArsR family regulator